MTRQPPPELFAQRPVRSDFGRRPSPVVTPRRVLLLLILTVLAIGTGVAVNWSAGEEEQPTGELPTIKAELPIKQKPEEPGGIDIPHQDVTVFQKLDNKAEGPKKTGVEHLLPPPETPTAPPPQAVPMAQEAAVASSVPAATPEKAFETEEPLPPPITEAVPAPTEPLKPEQVKEGPKVEKAAEKPSEKPVEKPKAESKPTPAKASPKAVEAPKTADAQKAEAAVARLPKELFTTGDVSAIPSPAPAPSVAQTKTPSPEQPAGKGVSIQLASYPDQPTAEREAKRMQSKYASALNGVNLRVVRADLGAKGTYFRVMGGPIAEAKAKAICAGLAAQKASCLVAR